jgi:lactate permease
MIGGAVFIALVKWKWPVGQPDDARAEDGMLLAALPYALVLAAILASRTVRAADCGLMQAVVLEWDLAGRFAGSVMPLYHPGTLLLLALAGAVIVRPGAGPSSGHHWPLRPAACLRWRSRWSLSCCFPGSWFTAA